MIPFPETPVIDSDLIVYYAYFGFNEKAPRLGIPIKIEKLDHEKYSPQGTAIPILIHPFYSYSIQPHVRSVFLVCSAQ